MSRGGNSPCGCMNAPCEPKGRGVNYNQRQRAHNLRMQSHTFAPSLTLVTHQTPNTSSQKSRHMTQCKMWQPPLPTPTHTLATHLAANTCSQQNRPASPNRHAADTPSWLYRNRMVFTTMAGKHLNQAG
eukprot:1159228-Pelagomonas_calceolata.AAC.13